jgi:hypothetical protein
MQDKLDTREVVGAFVTRGAAYEERVSVRGFFTVECVGRDGKLKWKDTIRNLVTTLGKNDLLDKYLRGAAYTQTFRMGLAGVGTKDVGDTQAAHAGWLEVGLANPPTYTGNRKDVAMGLPAGGSSVSPVQAFAITSAGTVAGCFTNNGGSATKDITTGVLYSAGDFTGGNKVVDTGDTLNVTYTATV